MSSWQDVQKALDMAQVVVSGVETIEKVLGLGQPAEAVVKAISAIISTVKAGAAGHVTADQVASSLQSLHDQLAAADTAADAAVDAKFPKS